MTYQEKGIVQMLASLEKQRSLLLVFAGTMLIGITGIIDFLTGHDISFSLFYGLPISLITWHSNRNVGFMASIASALVWLGADLATGVTYVDIIIPIWNAFIRLSFFVIITYLFTSLHHVNAELESRVQQRTKELVKSNLDLHRAYKETIEGWSRALDLRDKETEGHSQRVTEMTVRLAKVAGMSNDELMYVRYGALLHDIGKMGVQDDILHKPHRLSDEEWIIMKKHPEFSYALLNQTEYLRPALDIPYCHHEKWDGSGYPRGLKGEEIPFAARLFAVVDIWDALRFDRPYRKGWNDKEVLDHIKSLSGTHLDPKAVELFLIALSESR